MNFEFGKFYISVELRVIFVELRVTNNNTKNHEEGTKKHEEENRFTMKTISGLMLLALFGMLMHSSMAQQFEDEEFIVRIIRIDQEDAIRLEQAGIRLMWHDRLPEAQAIMTRARAEWLVSQGFDATILCPAAGMVDPEYHTYDEMCAHLDSLLILYPDLMTIDTLGYSHVMQYPIPIVKISDNPGNREDEAVIWYDGVHHAREPIGMEICLKLMDHLLSNYATDSQIMNWVDNTEIFIVPCMNPDGWKYVVDSSLIYPFWRKNLHDNDSNGLFQPYVDGVDLNRNYDFWWEYGISSPGSELYRGPAPFSETEIIGKRDFMLSRKPVLAISYHSYGEVVLFTKYLGFDVIPEWPVIVEIASHIAGLIPSLGGSHYSIGSVDGTTSNSHNWCLQAAGTIEFCVETADVFIPSGPIGQQVAADNLQGALYLLERAFKSGITGHAWDAETGEPLPATIEIVGLDNEITEPRTCDSLYGRYTRLLLPDTYTVRAFAENTDTITVINVAVIEDTLTVLDFELTRAVGFAESAVSGQRSAVRIYPNPTGGGIVNCQLSIVDCQGIVIKLYDIHGREVATIMEGMPSAGEHTMQFDASGLPAGIYFYRLTTLDSRLAATGKLVKL